MNISTMNSEQNMQRVDGFGQLAVKKSRSQTHIDRLYQQGSAKIRFPNSPGEALEAVLINTAGGLTGGDRIAWQANAAQGCTLALTTQASEKVYKSADGFAVSDIDLSAGKDASVSWLPQDTILFDKCAIKRSIEVNLDNSAHCLIVEPLTFGRQAMGETVRHCCFQDSWNIKVDGKLVHSEKFRIDGDATSILAGNACAGGARAMATILLVGPAVTNRMQEVRDCFKELDVTAGVSAWELQQTGKLLARIVAKDGYCLRNALAPLIRLLNGNAGLPKIWAT